MMQDFPTREAAAHAARTCRLAGAPLAVQSHRLPTGATVYTIRDGRGRTLQDDGTWGQGGYICYDPRPAKAWCPHARAR